MIRVSELSVLSEPGLERSVTDSTGDGAAACGVHAVLFRELDESYVSIDAVDVPKPAPWPIG